jgi:hypothetical protein
LHRFTLDDVAAVAEKAGFVPVGMVQHDKSHPLLSIPRPVMRSDSGFLKRVLQSKVSGPRESDGIAGDGRSRHWQLFGVTSE